MAFALKNNGWVLRSDIIWKKTNAMPSSVKNRPTTDHEYIFLFSKSTDYYYDADSIREPHVTFTKNSKMRGGRNHLGKRNGTPENGKNSGNQNLHNGRWDQAFHPKEGDIVFDPFTGSSTTGVVAVKNDRRFIGCELVKIYQEMAQKRIDEIVTQPSLF